MPIKLEDIPEELHPDTLVRAYASGYFPMPHPETGETVWFQPDPRAILPLDGFHLSRSMKKYIKNTPYQLSVNTKFQEVMQRCSDRKDTWISEEFKVAYEELHKLGYAHSFELWLDDQLTAGVYGVQVGAAFFAESKFGLKTNTSKAALYELTKFLRRKNFQLLETQFLTPHLESLGVIEIPHEEYMTILNRAIQTPAHFAS